ncbi:Citrate-binding protein [Capsicum baccatum]|uniref:Citrate-binding protein n=1 Tax=Capsicum baccatum TaxID=33114 RepID=A0A2G2VG21_CAPBA|nr:Citrate-binding protein [Capsicum baccatum]
MSGYVFTIGGGAVSWKSSKQTCITRSTMESEFSALDKAGEEAKWLQNFLEDIPYCPKLVAPVCIHCDIQAAIGRAGSMMYNGKSCHIRWRHNIVRKLLSSGIITVDYVKSKDNVSDPLTKGLSREGIERTSKGMGLRPRTSQHDVPISQSNFQIQKPYDVPVNQRYSFIDGVHRCWVFKTDKPHTTTSQTKPRIEIRITVDYMLQQITYLVQQISDLFLWFSMDYSSIATGRLYVASDKIPDCKENHDGVINSINALTPSVKEMTSKRGVIPSKRISYPDTPLEIKAAKRGKKDTSKASSIIKKKQDSNASVFVLYRCGCHIEATAEEHNITVDNPSTASKEEEKVESVSLGEWKNYPFEGFNISDEALKELTQLINDYSEWIANRLLKHHAGRIQNDEHYIVNESSLGFDMFNFVVAYPRMKNWFYLMLQSQTCWNDEHIDVIFYYLQKKAKLQTQEQYRYTTSNYLYKAYINNAYDRYCQQQSKVFRNEECLINIIKYFSISAGLPWYLVDEVYIPIYWVLAVIVLKERHIRVYDSMSQRRYFGPSSEIQKLAKILPTYLDMSGFLDQKVCTDWSTIEAYRDKMANPLDVQYVEGISQQTIGILDFCPFVTSYAEYLSDGLQVPDEGIDARLLQKRYAVILGK